MRRTNLRGHALRGEGKAHIRGYAEQEQPPWVRARGHIGRGLCECGAVSPEAWTDADRKAWHSRHKDEIRAQLEASRA